MEKALEILQNIYFDDRGYMCVEKSTALDVFNAIKELEEAMRKQTCEGCTYLYINKYDEWVDYCKEINIEIPKTTVSSFYCNRYEAKDNK